MPLPDKDILTGGSDGGLAGLGGIKNGQLLATVYQDKKVQADDFIELALEMVRKNSYIAKQIVILNSSDTGQRFGEFFITRKLF